MDHVCHDLGVTDARVVCWGLFTAWVVHDTEEVVTATCWSRRTAPRLQAEGWPGWLVDSATTTTGRFAVAAAVVGVVVLVVAWRGARTGGRSPMFQAAVLVFGWHGLVHMGQAVLLRGYVPGLVGAVLVVIPLRGMGLARVRPDSRSQPSLDCRGRERSGRRDRAHVRRAITVGAPARLRTTQPLRRRRVSRAQHPDGLAERPHLGMSVREQSVRR